MQYGLTQTWRELAERKRMEEALRESEEKYRVVFNNEIYAICIFDLETLKLLDANEAHIRLYGYSREEIVSGMTIHDITVEHQASDAASAQATREGTIFIPLRYHRKKDGTIFPVEIVGGPYVWQGRKVMFALAHDITVRKQLEDEITTAKERLEMIVASSAVMLYTSQAFGDFDVTYISDNISAIAGYTCQDFLLKGFWASHIHPEDAPKVFENLPKLFEQNHLKQEYRFLFKDDTYHWMCDELKLNRDENGNPLVIIGTWADITERVQAEEALRESEANLSAVFSATEESVFLLAADETLLALNDGAAQRMGRPREALIGRNLAELLPPDVDARRRPFIARAFLTGQPISFEDKRDGCWMMNHLYPIPGVDGQVARLAVFSSDITARKQMENLLKKTRKNYETFFNSIDDLLFVLDEQGNILHTNSTVTDRLGYSEEELIGESVLMVHPPERRDEAGRIVGEMLAGAAEFCPVPVITKSGERIPVETRVTPGFWDGKPVIFGVTKDMSQIKLSEEKFSKAFQSNSALMALSHFEDGTYIDVNDVFLETLGFSRDEVIGKTSNGLHIFADTDQRDEIIEKIKLDRKVENVVVAVRTKGGSLRYGLFSADTIYIGKDLCLLTVMVDITARVQAEKALLESEMRFRSLFEQTHDAVFILDLNGRHIAANQRAADMLGYTKDEIANLSVNETSAEKKQSHDILGRVRTGEHIPSYERLFRKKDGQIIPVEINVELVRDKNGNPLHIQSVVRDISERKRAEGELRRAQDELETAHRELQQSFAREQKLAHTDMLTDINNHDFLLQLVEREFEVAMRYRPPLSVMFFDIDDFKQINDTFGHAIGDRALKKLIQVVRAEIRSADVIGRYGGDEFVILLPQTSAQEALPFAERIHASIAAMRVETDKGALTLTISIGIAQTIHPPVSESGYIAPTDTVENLLLRADQALYAAKQAGKNCTVIFDSK